MEIKFESSFLSFEISVKRSTNDDPITQDTVEKCIRITPVRDKILFIKVGRLTNILYLYRLFTTSHKYI